MKANSQTRPSLKRTLKQLVTEGRLDEDTARLLDHLATEGVKVRKALRNILKSWSSILDSAAVIRGDVNVIFNNVEDVENYSEVDEDD